MKKPATHKIKNRRGLDEDDYLKLGASLLEENSLLHLIREWAEIHEENLMKSSRALASNPNIPDRVVHLSYGQAGAFLQAVDSLYTRAKEMYEKENG